MIERLVFTDENIFHELLLFHCCDAKRSCVFRTKGNFVRPIKRFFVTIEFESNRSDIFLKVYPYRRVNVVDLTNSN